MLKNVAKVQKNYSEKCEIRRRRRGHNVNSMTQSTKGWGWKRGLGEQSE